MTEHQPKTFLETFSRITQIAIHYLDGPRSVMPPDDPDGLGFWLEPVIRMKVKRVVGGSTRSLIVYCVPNSLEHDAHSLVLVREAAWDGRLDKELCKKGGCDWPSVTITYKAAGPEQVSAINDTLCRLDQSMSSFPFRAEGLDLSGSSGTRPMPENAAIAQEAVHYQLSRITRFYYIELHWGLDERRPLSLDQCFQALSDILVKIAGDPPFQPIEKYDIDPRDYGTVIKQ